MHSDICEEVIIEELSGIDIDERKIDEISRIDEELFSSNVWGRESYKKSAENDYDFLVCAFIRDDLDEADSRKGAEEAVCGFALLRLFDDAELIRIAVAPKYRRRGIGERLLAELIGEAKRREVHDIILEVRASNEPAGHMYEKAGFVTEGIRKKYYSDPAEDAVIMRFKW